MSLRRVPWASEPCLEGWRVHMQRDCHLRKLVSTSRLHRSHTISYAQGLLSDSYKTRQQVLHTDEWAKLAIEPHTSLSLGFSIW